LLFLKSIDKVLGLAVALLFLSFSAARAQVHAHPNSVEIKRESTAQISFNFELNLPPLLHRMLAPQTSYAVFLKNQTALSDQALDREMAEVGAAFSEKAFLVLPSGTKLRLKQWQWPDKKVLRDAFMSSFVLLYLPQNINTHVDPIRVTASVQTKTPPSRVQLQLPSPMNPILVVIKSDQFWLTDHIPSAVIEIN
jgi:hypothetical protein